MASSSNIQKSIEKLKAIKFSLLIKNEKPIYVYQKRSYNQMKKYVRNSYFTDQQKANIVLFYKSAHPNV